MLEWNIHYDDEKKWVFMCITDKNEMDLRNGECQQRTKVNDTPRFGRARPALDPSPRGFPNPSSSLVPLHKKTPPKTPKALPAPHHPRAVRPHPTGGVSQPLFTIGALRCEGTITWGTSERRRHVFDCETYSRRGSAGFSINDESLLECLEWQNASLGTTE